MKKRLLTVLSVILTFLMLGGSFSFAASVDKVSVDQFSDVAQSDWFYNYVKFVADPGSNQIEGSKKIDWQDKAIMNGTSKTTFEPQTELTRAMFATILARYDQAVVDDSKATIFTDVETGQWYTGSIGWANENNIVQGYGNNVFGTVDKISRQDLALMIYRYIKNYYEPKHNLKIKVHGGEYKEPIEFKDKEDIRKSNNEETVIAVNNCVEYGLILGYPDGTFKPTQDITRAETAAIIYRLTWILNQSGGNTPYNPVTTSYQYVVKANFAKDGNGPVLIKAYSESEAKKATAGQIALDLVTANEAQIKNDFIDAALQKLMKDWEGKTYSQDGYNITKSEDGTMTFEGVDLVASFNKEYAVGQTPKSVYETKMDAVREGVGIPSGDKWDNFVKAFSLSSLFVEADDGTSLKVKDAQGYYDALVAAVTAAKELQESVKDPVAMKAILENAEKYGDKLGVDYVDENGEYTLNGTSLDSKLADNLDDTFDQAISKLLTSSQPLVDLMPDNKEYDPQTVFSATESFTDAQSVIDTINARTSRNWTSRPDIKAVINSFEFYRNATFALTVTVEKTEVTEA